MDVKTLPKLLDGSFNEVERLHPISLSISENIVPLSTASMVLPKEESIPERGWVELFTVNGSVGIFRARTPTTGYGGYSDTYSLEHAICDVGDWLVRDNIDRVAKTLGQALAQVFSYYGGNKWQLGSVCSGDVVLTANYANVLQTMNSLIKQVEGAAMTFDFSTTPWTINVVSLGDTVNAEGRLSRNVKKARVSRNDTNLCTRVWVDGLTGGHMDADTITTYGVVEKKLSGEEYTAQQASIVASAYLAKYKRPIYSISIDGADFSEITGETLDRVAIGKLYRLVIPEDGVTLNEHITAISWKDAVKSPYTVTITLSEPESTMTQFVGNQTSGFYGADGALHNYDLAKNRIWSRFEVMNSQILAEVGRATESENEIDGKLTREKELIYTRITQTAEAITSEANRATQVESQLGNEISTVNTTLSSRITQTAEAITSEVTRATAAETQISGNLTTLNENLSSRITQNASSITAEVTRASTAETRIDGRITTEVTNIGSRISMESDRISLVVSGSGAYAAINVVGIVNEVNSSQVTIDADRVDISGSVVVSQLRDDFDNLTDGTLWADTLAADTVWATGLHVTTAMGFCNQVVGYADVTINGTNYRVMTLT